MSQTTIQTTLGADLPTNGTFQVGYPQGKSRGDFLNGVAHYAMIGQDRYNEGNAANNVSFAFNAANIVITYRGLTTQKAGAGVILNLDEPGPNNSEMPGGALALPTNVTGMQLITMDLGAPAAAVANAVALTQAVAAGANGLLNGPAVANGVARFDVPRALAVAFTGAANLTVDGLDKNGKAVREVFTATGTGKKALVAVTKATFDAAVTAVTIGTSDVLGLPSWLPATGHVLRELQDGATAAAGAIVAGLPTANASLGNTADVRGTYDPSAACNGVLAFKLIVALEDPAFQGNAQFVA